MTQKQSARDDAITALRETLKPGDTVYTVLRNVSRSGMTRSIDAYVIHGNSPHWISRRVAAAIDAPFDEKRDAVKMGGCGMDMGFALVYQLSHTLYPAGFDCIGEGCPANDHVNARKTNCAVCGAALNGVSPYSRPRGKDWSHAVCSQACASGKWLHSDGGYALKHKWM